MDAEWLPWVSLDIKEYNHLQTCSNYRLSFPNLTSEHNAIDLKMHLLLLFTRDSNVWLCRPHITSPKVDWLHNRYESLLFTKGRRKPYYSADISLHPHTHHLIILLCSTQDPELVPNASESLLICWGALTKSRGKDVWDNEPRPFEWCPLLREKLWPLDANRSNTEVKVWHAEWSGNLSDIQKGTLQGDESTRPRVRSFCRPFASEPELSAEVLNVNPERGTAHKRLLGHFLK